MHRLPTLADVDRLLALSRWDPGEVSVEHDGVPVLPAQQGSNRAAPEGTPALARIALAFAKGCTVRMRGLERRWRLPADTGLPYAELVLIPRETTVTLPGVLRVADGSATIEGDRVTTGPRACLVVRYHAEEPPPAPTPRVPGLPTLRELDYLVALSRPRVVPGPTRAFEPERWEEGEPDLLRLVAAQGQVRIELGPDAAVLRTPGGRGRFERNTVVRPLAAQRWDGRVVERGEALFLPAGHEWEAGPGTALVVSGQGEQPLAHQGAGEHLPSPV